MTNFGVSELKEFFECEKLAYEIWRISALLRIIGKGAHLIVEQSSEFIGDDRSDELAELVTIYDQRNIVFNVKNTTAKGVIYDEKISSKNRGGFVLLPIYNLNNESSTIFDEILETAFNFKIDPPIIFNFIWFPMNIRAYAELHSPFSKSFEKKYKIPYNGLLLVLVSLLLRVMSNWENSKGDAFIKFSQRAYEGPIIYDNIIYEINAFLPTAGEVLNVDDKLSNINIKNIIKFLSCDYNRTNIGLQYPGPHSVFLPIHNEMYIIDYAWIHRRLYDLFLGISIPDQNFKGNLLEDYIQNENSPITNSKLNANDGSSRQIDATFEVGNCLLVVECRVFERSIGFDRGDTKSIEYRTLKIDNLLEDIDEKANWLRKNPVGTNYDIRKYDRILPIGVTPFIEFLPSLKSFYWLSKGLPRIMSPAELNEFIKAKQNLNSYAQNMIWLK